MYHVYEALELTPYEEVKVVILGQDPYHGVNQAHGLSFSVQPGVKTPPSLFNIYKELKNDLGIEPVSHGNLVTWAKQGVLLLNTVLTVREGQAYSHRGKGWEQLTDAIIEKLNERDKPIVFILWGKPAQEKMKMIDKSRHIIITAHIQAHYRRIVAFLVQNHFQKRMMHCLLWVKHRLIGNCLKQCNDTALSCYSAVFPDYVKNLIIIHYLTDTEI